MLRSERRSLPIKDGRDGEASRILGEGALGFPSSEKPMYFGGLSGIGRKVEEGGESIGGTDTEMMIGSGRIISARL